MFFSPSRAVLSAILRDECLTSAVKTKEGDKQAAVSRRRVTQSNLSWSWRQTI